MPQITHAQKFWRNVDKSAGPSGCWVYTRNISDNGYGRISIGPSGAQVTYYAHRFSWSLVNGPIPDGLVICHTCDNPPCVNPAHLFIGTRGDNARDMAAKGRQWKQRATHCAHGHEWTPENTLRRSKAQQRVCRTCEKARQKRRRVKGASPEKETAHA